MSGRGEIGRPGSFEVGLVMKEKFKSLFGTQDMTIGKPSSCLLKFIIPMLIGNIAQMLLITFDRAIVGHFIGDAALGAVGASMPVLNIFMVFFMAIGSGVTIIVAQYFGAKDFDNLSKVVGNTLMLLICIAIIVTSVATPLTGPLLRAIDTAPELYVLAYNYLFIMFCGCATTGCYNITAGILRGVGSAIYPLIVLLCSVVLNAILVVLFVAPWGLDLGIKGAACATLIAQFGSAIACLTKVLISKHLFVITKKSLRPNSLIMKQIVRIGLPSGIQMAIMFLSNLILQPYIMRMGYQVMAAMTATMSVDGFAVLPSQAFSMGISTYTGQNIGAGKRERLKPGMFATLRTSIGVTAIMVCALLVFGRPVLGLFTQTKSLIDMGMSFIYVMVPAYLLMSVNMTFNGIMRGAGDAVGTMWMSVLTNVILKIPLTILLINLSKTEILPGGEPKSMFYGMLCSMIVGTSVTLIYYRIGRWKTKSVIRTPIEPIMEI